MTEHTAVLGNDEGIIDLEIFAKGRQQVPPFTPGTRYRIRIDKEQFVVSVDHMTGAEILGLVGKTPNTYRLDMKLHGGATQKIEATQVVYFTAPGIEKFMTLPLDQTEGAYGDTLQHHE